MARAWFRFYTNALDNPKVLKLTAPQFRFWVSLLCIATEEDAAGALPEDAYIAARLRVRRDFVLSSLAALQAYGLLDIARRRHSRALGTAERRSSGRLDKENLSLTDAQPITKNSIGRLATHPTVAYKVHNWAKFQYESDTSTARVKRFRERFSNVTETPPEQSRADTDQKRSDPSDRPLPAPPSPRQAFFSEQNVGKQNGALIRHFMINGVVLTDQQKKRLGQLVKEHGHGKTVWDTAVTALTAEGDPIDLMTKILKGVLRHDSRAAPADEKFDYSRW